jgi:hypothetical protein
MNIFAEGRIYSVNSTHSIVWPIDKKISFELYLLPQTKTAVNESKM